MDGGPGGFGGAMPGGGGGAEADGGIEGGAAGGATGEEGGGPGGFGMERAGFGTTGLLSAVDAGDGGAIGAGAAAGV